MKISCQIKPFTTEIDLRKKIQMIKNRMKYGASFSDGEAFQ